MQNAKCLRRTVLISVLKIYTKFYMHFRTREKIQKKKKQFNLSEGIFYLPGVSKQYCTQNTGQNC